jgi:hydroxyacylglutathione hydrolase
MTTLDVEPIALLRDNYAYLVTDRASRQAVVVDPSEGAKVVDAVRERGVKLVAVWCTHHHPDHTGGVEEIVSALGPLEVIGSRYDREHGRIPRQTQVVGEGDVLGLGTARFEVLEIPGHTLGAIAFVSRAPAIAFTGDTLFSGGCGRVFEGTMAMMRASLAKLAALPDDTRVYSGHEYTVKNLEFALVVEPQSDAVRSRLAEARDRRDVDAPTVGGTIALEKGTNPFLRWAEPAVRAFAASRGEASTDDEVFARVREAKNAF